jgi:hypothetical protein
LKAAEIPCGKLLAESCTVGGAPTVKAVVTWNVAELPPSSVADAGVTLIEKSFTTTDKVIGMETVCPLLPVTLIVGL